ncbi:hypothetical protein [Flagellimonas sp.]|uniref:hypothetical protein n=1 Tax=Flagellimonas sp. TaxID=2058762 RepID=UPI003F4A4252
MKDMKYSYTEDMQVIRVSTSQKGEILTERFNSINDDRPFREEKAVNILEYCSLMLFTISVIFLTTAFSGLGVFFYTKSANS